MALKLVIFDLDGTLLEAMLDFNAIRAEIGLPPAIPILEAIDAMSDADRARARAVLDRHEAAVAEQSRLMPGARELLAHLRGRGIRTAVLTRNSRASVDLAIRRHGLAFDASVARDEHRPKPSPDGVHYLMAACGAGVDETIVVGDYRFDIEAGRNAGVRTIALISQSKTRRGEPKPWAQHATWVASSLLDVQRLLDAAATSPLPSRERGQG
jgi:HAD superfamily hydrolase (TIGR01509 family)